MFPRSCTYLRNLTYMNSCSETPGNILAMFSRRAVAISYFTISKNLVVTVSLMCPHNFEINRSQNNSEHNFGILRHS